MNGIDQQATYLITLLDTLAIVIEQHLDDPKRLHAYVTAWDVAGEELHEIVADRYAERRARTAPQEVFQQYTVLTGPSGAELGSTRGFEGIADTLVRHPTAIFRPVSTQP